MLFLFIFGNLRLYLRWDDGEERLTYDYFGASK